jgi:hypothetical protein
MTTRSTKLFGGTIANTGSTILYTCPEGEVALFKSCGFAQPGATATDFSAWVGAGDGSAAITFRTGTLESNKFDWWEGWIVLEPGDQIAVYVNQPGLQVWASGALLPAPPAT